MKEYMDINYENYRSLKDQKLSRLAIAEAFNIPEWKLKRIISYSGWGAKIPTFKNNTAFLNYTEQSCYWAGFMAADGCVDSKNRLRLMLNYDDLTHLEKFKEYLQAEHKISINTDTYYRASLELTSLELCEQLEDNFNIVPNKTSIMKFPEHINKNMFKHFIRGYFDGDGSICESFSNKNSVTKSLYATFACGSPEFIIYLFEYLKTALKLEGHLQDFRPTSEKHQIKYNTNDAKKLLDWMYKDASVYLDRKHAKYMEIVVNKIRQTR